MFHDNNLSIWLDDIYTNVMIYILYCGSQGELNAVSLTVNTMMRLNPVILSNK